MKIYPVKDYKAQEFRDVKIFRGNRPKPGGDIYFLVRIGMKGVVCLENDKDVIEMEAAWCAKVGLHFVSFPMSDIFSPTSVQLRRGVKLLEAIEMPVFVHCRKGEDRTGFFIAAYRMIVQGWSYEDAMNECRKYGHNKYLYFWWNNALRTLIK